MNTDSNSAVLECNDDIPTSITLAPDLYPDNLPSRGQHSRLSAHRVAFIALLISVVGLLAALGWPLLTGQVYTADDLGWFHLPMRSFYSQQLAHGEPFDWCPNMFSGFYLTGEGQVGSYHPLHWLLYRTLPLSVAFDLECWLSYPLMLAGMYLFLRRWKLRQEAATFGAMVFTFGSFNLLHLIHLNGVAIMAHLPWLLWAIDVMLRSPSSYQTGEKSSAEIPASKRNRRLAFCAVALLTGSQLLLGYPQYVFFSLVVEAGYVLLLSTVAGASLSAAAAGLFRWAIAVLIGALIGGVQLLPTFDALIHSVRQSTAVENFATQGSMPILNWMQLVTPYLFATRVVGGITHEFGMYMGAVPLALAVWWICSGKRHGQFQALTIAALATAAVALLWTMGGLGPLGWLQEHLPLLNKFRLPSRAIVVFQLAIAVLATLGFAMLLETARNSIRREEEFTSPSPAPTQLKQKDRRPLLWTLPLVSAVFTLLALRYWRPYLAPYPLVALGPVMMAAAVSLILRATQGARWAVAALVVLSAVDLGIYGMSYSVYGHVESLPKFIAEVDAPPGFPSKHVVLDLASGTEAAPGQKTVRSGDQILLKGWKRVDGYAGLDPAKQLDYRDPAALRAAGVEWIAAEAATQMEQSGHAGWLAKNDRKKMVPDKPIYSIGKNNIWFRLGNPQPKAWLVSKTMVSDKPATDIGHISLATEALVEKEISPLTPTAQKMVTETASPQAESPHNSAVQPEPPRTVNMVADQPGNLSFGVKCSTQQLLVVGESYHSGWQATVDNQPAAVLRTDGDFMGVVIAPGDHEIALKFQPQSLHYGRLASGFGLSLLVVMVLSAAWPWRQRHD